MKSPLMFFAILTLMLSACAKKAALLETDERETKTPVGRAVNTNVFTTRNSDPTAITTGNPGTFGNYGYFNGNTNSWGNYGVNPVENAVAYKLDSFLPNLMPVFDSQWPFIRSCDSGQFNADRFNQEKQWVLQVANNYPTQYIPVRYAVAVGNIVDGTAHLSHQRTILRSNFNGIVNVPVGAANTTADGSLNHANRFYYKTNASGAAFDFAYGKMCFFNVIKVVEGVAANVPLPDGTVTTSANYNHTWNYMLYGATYDMTNPTVAADVATGLKSPRLFKKLENLTERQILPLYVADFRATIPKLEGGSIPILRTEAISQLPRLYEYQGVGKSLFNLVNVVRYRDRITQVLSTTRTVWALNNAEVAAGTPGATAYAHQAYVAVPQLLNWIVQSGVTGTVMAASYTPIVLDLDQRGIITSSVRQGTYFNTGMFRNYADSNPATMYDVHYQTAWLGGEIEPTGMPNSINVHYRPTMKDGFLVLPDANGEIKDARNLVGEFTPVTVNGTTRTFSDGYQALAALTNKNCSVPASDPRAYYLGPWDLEMYSRLKVWIDVNRNGYTDPGEVRSLADAGVAALNVCKLFNRPETDQYGNDTSKRSVFLYMPNEQIIGNEAEIIRRITTGRTSFNQPIDVRASIDIHFRANFTNYLEPYEASNVGR